VESSQREVLAQLGKEITAVLDVEILLLAVKLVVVAADLEQ
jgi:hypothetical protein